MIGSRIEVKIESRGEKREDGRYRVGFERRSSIFNPRLDGIQSNNKTSFDVSAAI